MPFWPNELYTTVKHTNTYTQTTRNMEHSPTWGRPAPWVRWGSIQGKGETYLSSKVTWPEVKCSSSSIDKMRIVDLGCVHIRACNLFVSGPKFTKFFASMREGWQSIKFVIDFRYVDLIQIYSRSNFEVAHNRTKFWTWVGQHLRPLLYC